MVNTERKILIQAEGIRLRPIEIDDAEFIVDLRTNEKRRRYISYTSPIINEQIKWIIEYKKRESIKKEFYFIIEDSVYKPWGTIRLYNLTSDNFTFGSWLCLPKNNDFIAIKAYLLGIEFGFDKLNYKTCLTDVRKQNRNVLKFVHQFNPQLINEDELSFFFKIDKETYYKNREKVIILFDLNF